MIEPRGGFGVFTDVFPATIADNMLDNPPLNNEFQILDSGLGGPTMPCQPPPYRKEIRKIQVFIYNLSIFPFLGFIHSF